MIKINNNLKYVWGRGERYQAINVDLWRIRENG